MSDKQFEEVQELLAKITNNPRDRESAERVSDILMPNVQIMATTQGLEEISVTLLKKGVHPESFIVAVVTVLMKLYQERYSDELTDDKIAYWIQNIGEFSKNILTFATEKMDFILEVLPEEQLIQDIPQTFFDEAKQWRKVLDQATRACKDHDVELKIELTTVVIQSLDQFMGALAKLETPIEIEVCIKCLMALWIKVMLMGFADDPDNCFYIIHHWESLYPFMINDFMQSLWKD